MNQPQLRVRDIGEQGLLLRLQKFCRAEIVGDDGAVLPMQPGRELVVTTDVLVDGVHFSDRTTTPEDAGWRAVAANLSDLAAMGAVPEAVTVGLGLPGNTAVEWVERLYQGMTACLAQYGGEIVGGDVVRSPVITLSITAFGLVAPDQVIRRNTAQPGDAIVITGYHGASRAGLELLLYPDRGRSLTDEHRQFLIHAHQRPVPRLDVLPLMQFAQTAPSGFDRITGMDSSDGLADAVLQLCRASGVGARIIGNSLPVPPGLMEWVGEAQAFDWILYGGEDFELVLCLPPQQARLLVAQLGVGAALIGEVTAERSVWLVDETAGDRPLSLDHGFQHFNAQ